MKRAFLFGLGSFLILMVFAGIRELFRGDQTSIFVGAVMIVLGGGLSLVAIRKAKTAPPNRTWGHAIGGWILGFCITNAVLLTPIALIHWLG